MNTQELAMAAIRLKNDPAAQEVLSMMAQAAIKKWEQAQTQVAREAAWYERSAVGQFQLGLQTLADRGVVERITEERASARK